MINHKIYDLMFAGVNSATRSHKSASQLQDFIENKCTLDPVYWIGVDFHYGVSEDKARMKIATFINTINHRILKTHIWPVVVWNKNSEALVKNDVHIIMMMDRKSLPMGSYGIIRKEISKLWKNGRRPFIELYQRGNNAVHYSTLRHNEIGFMVFCPDRGTCRNSHKNKNDCVYRKNPSLLIKTTATASKKGGK